MINNHNLIPSHSAMVAWTDTAKDAYYVIIWPSPQFRKKRRRLHKQAQNKSSAFQPICIFFQVGRVRTANICLTINVPNHVDSIQSCA